MPLTGSGCNANPQSDNEQLDLCLRVLGVAATRIDSLEQSGTPSDADGVHAVAVQYLMLRAQLVCRTLSHEAKSITDMSL